MSSRGQHLWRWHYLNAVNIYRNRILQEALDAITALPTARCEREENGQESAYRAVEALKGKVK